MADSTSILAPVLLTQNQAAKEAAANNMFNMATPAMIWAVDPSTTAALTFGLIGGRYQSAPIASQTKSLTDNADNYLVAAISGGTVTVATSTTNWNDSANYIRLYKVVAASGLITSYEDHRTVIVSSSTPGATDLSWTASTRVLASSTGTDATITLVTSGDAGLAPASGGGSSNFLRADGTWAVPGGAGTNLAYGPSTRLLTSDTGTDVTLPLFTSTEAGLVPLSGGGTTNFLRADGTWATGGDASTNTATSVDSEIALFSSTTGKIIKRATGTGYAKVTSGVFSADSTATVQADLQGNGLGSTEVGFRIIPQNSKSAAYTTVAADSGKHILHPSADTNARTFTIDSNANVAYPIGTAITFINMVNTVTIAITSDTMYLAGAGTTGSRTLAAYGVATAVKIDTTQWVISGTGLT